ncbi:MAG: cytochrome P450 [Solirubrobacteraceae bacterium]
MEPLWSEDGGGVPRIEYDLLAPEIRDDPYPLYARLRSAGPIHWSESLSGWGLTRHEEVRAALDREDLSAARFSPYLEAARTSEPSDPVSIALYEALETWFTFADPPGHTRLRALARGVIAPPMKAMAPTVDALVRELVERAAERGEIDVIAELARPASVGTVVRLLGVPTADEPLFTDWSEALTDYIGGAVDVRNRRDRAWTALGELRAYLTELVRERTRSPGTDLLSALVGARRGGDALSEEEVVATAAMMLFAGHGTSTNTVGNGLLALMRNPDQSQALADGSASAEQAVEELLRYDSPVQITVRNAVCDGALGCPEIGVGDRVFLFIGSANRDLAGVQRADELDVRRLKSAHITFGYGIHFCIGAPLARIEVPLVFKHLFSRFAAIEPLSTELRWQPTVGFRGLRELRVAVRPR